MFREVSGRWIEAEKTGLKTNLLWELSKVGGKDCALEKIKLNRTSNNRSYKKHRAFIEGALCKLPRQISEKLKFGFSQKNEVQLFHSWTCPSAHATTVPPTYLHRLLSIHAAAARVFL